MAAEIRNISKLAESPYSGYMPVFMGATMGVGGAHSLRFVSLGAPDGPAPGAWLTWTIRRVAEIDEPHITILGVDGSTPGALHPLVSPDGRVRFAADRANYSSMTALNLVMAFGTMLARPAESCGECVPPEAAAAHAAAHCRLSLSEVVANGGWRRDGSILPLPTIVDVLRANYGNPGCITLSAESSSFPLRPSWEEAADLQLLLLFVDDHADRNSGVSAATAMAKAARAAGSRSLVEWIGLW